MKKLTTVSVLEARLKIVEDVEKNRVEYYDIPIRRKL